MERNLLKQGGNIIAPPAGKRVLIWLDDLNLNTSSTKPESLVRNIETQGGWFSLNRFNLTKVLHTNFLLSMSVSEENLNLNAKVFDSINLDLLSKTACLRIPRSTLSQINRVFADVLSSTFDILAPNSSELVISGYIRQLINVAYFNREKMGKFAATDLVNIDLTGMLGFAKTLNHYDWATINKDPLLTKLIWVKILKQYLCCNLTSQRLDF